MMTNAQAVSLALRAAVRANMDAAADQEREAILLSLQNHCPNNIGELAAQTLHYLRQEHRGWVELYTKLGGKP